MQQVVTHNIFMAMVERVGHDKRGNTLFKRDRDGNEIWVSEDSLPMQHKRSRKKISGAYAERRTRVIDDQSLEVPSIFAQWKREEGIGW